MGHGFHHSRSHTHEKHEHRRNDDRGHRDQDHCHGEFGKDSVSSRYSSPSPTCSCVSSHKSPEILSVPKPKKEDNVLENMDTSFTDGPLEILKDCVHDGKKVMVWIRNHNGIRGICTGFVLAFDKFWNLLMQDVDEVYQKSRYPKTPFLQSVEELCHLPETGLVKKKKKKLGEQSKPEFGKDAEISESARQEARERKKRKKEEEKKKRAQERAALCKRNVTKIFIRGDNIVLVRGHGSHHSRRHTHEEHEHRRHDDRGHRDHNRYHGESRMDSVPSRYSSPSPTRPRVSSYRSPEILSVPKPRKEENILENMMETGFTDGPLDLLKNCVHDGRKVMVWIRNRNEIRGICTGFVLAFDKFWNLVMQDCDEVYRKSRHPKTPFLLSVREGLHLPEASLVKKKKPAEQFKPKPKKDVEISESAQQEARERRKIRKEEEKKKKRAEEKASVRKRNLKKIFIRGDNIVLIKVCEMKEDEKGSRKKEETSCRKSFRAQEKHE